MAVTQPLVLVTGATQGVGRATAQSLARDHGYHVLIGARNLPDGDKVAAEIKASGYSATAIQLDLSSRESIESAVAKVEQDFGYLDALINNAGVLLDFDTSLTTWDLYSKSFTVNVIGPATLTESLLPLLRKSRAGPPRLVFVSSRMGSLKTSTDKTVMWYPIEYTAYDATKTAVNMIMLNYNRKLDGTGAKVNSVCPGLVKTNLTRYIDMGTTPEFAAEHVVKMATLGPDGPTGTFSAYNEEIAW